MPDLVLYAGNSGVMDVAVTGPTGLAYDLTGATLSFYASDGIHSISKSSSSGITITSLTGGLCEVAFLPADTYQWPSSTLQWRLNVIESGGDTYTVAAGFLEIVQPVAAEAA